MTLRKMRLTKIVESMNMEFEQNKMDAKDYLHTLSWIAATGKEGLADKLANQAVNEKVRMKGKILKRHQP